MLSFEQVPVRLHAVRRCGPRERRESGYQIYDESPDGRFGFRDSFAGATKTEEPEEDAISAIDVVEISSKRVVLPSPKEALTPIHLRRQPQAWSSDSKHLALSFQTGSRTWTTTLYEWDGKEFAEVPWPRDAILKRIEEEQAAQLKALGLPEGTPRKLVYEGFTALDWVDATAAKMIAERIVSVILSKDQPPVELDARFRFVIKIRDLRKTEIADVAKILGTSEYGDQENRVEARLADEQPNSFYLIKDVEEGQQPFHLYALERFWVVGEKGNDYVVEDGCYNKGRVPRRLVHKFPSAFSSGEMDSCAESLGVYYYVLVKDAESRYLPALRAVFAFGEFDGGAAEVHEGSLNEIKKFVSARQISEAKNSFSAENSDTAKPSKSSAIRRGKLTDFRQVLTKRMPTGAWWMKTLADPCSLGAFQQDENRLTSTEENILRSPARRMATTSSRMPWAIRGMWQRTSWRQCLSPRRSPRCCCL